MNRPAGIEKDVWEAAKSASGAWGLLGSYDELVLDFAKAIQAERERCADLARTIAVKTAIRSGVTPRRRGVHQG